MKIFAIWSLKVVGWLVLLMALTVMVAAVVVPRLWGAQPYTVLTGSMRPHYPPGTLVIVRPAKPSALKVGNVATYQLISGRPGVVTHRIVAIWRDLEGQERFQFKGDANPSPDAALVLPKQIRGKLWYFIPYLGYAAELIDVGDRWKLNDLLGALLIIYAFWSYSKWILEFWKGEKSEGQTTQKSWAKPLSTNGLALCLLVVFLGTFSLAATRAFWTDQKTIGGQTFSQENLPAPTLSCGELGLASVTFSWTAVAGAQSYTLFYNGGANSITTTATSSTSLQVVSSSETAWVRANQVFGGVTWYSPDSNVESYWAVGVTVCQAAT